MTLEPQTALLIAYGLLGLFALGIFVYAKVFLIDPLECEWRKRR
jgi:hypothetical protein